MNRAMQVYIRATEKEKLVELCKKKRVTPSSFVAQLVYNYFDEKEGITRKLDQQCELLDAIAHSIKELRKQDECTSNI